MTPSRWLILFDWDGTLVQTLDVKIRNAGELFEETAGLPAGAVEAAYRRHSGIPRRQLFDAIRADFNLPPLPPEEYEPLSQRFTELNVQSLLTNGASGDRGGILLPETVPALKALRSQGCSLYVSSSADRSEILNVAGFLGLAVFFEEILGSSPGFTKGSLHVEHVRHKHNARLDEVVFVGDDPADVRLGRSAGVFTIARVGTHSYEHLASEGPDLLVNSLEEIPAILER